MSDVPELACACPSCGISGAHWDLCPESRIYDHVWVTPNLRDDPDLLEEDQVVAYCSVCREERTR